MRYAAKVEPDYILDLIDKRLHDDGHYGLLSDGKLGNDLKKVDFDFENFEYESKYDASCGPKKIGDLSFVMCYAGGDWEYPVNFIIYLDQDGKTLRGYIPKRGNAYNHTTKRAFGNDETQDAKYILKTLKKDYPVTFEKANELAKVSEYDLVDIYQDSLFDEEAILNDIKNRIVVKC